jgi:hypothetical protein
MSLSSSISSSCLLHDALSQVSIDAIGAHRGATAACGTSIMLNASDNNINSSNSNSNSATSNNSNKQQSYIETFPLPPPWTAISVVSAASNEADGMCLICS